jgi:hypothetical protein
LTQAGFYHANFFIGLIVNKTGVIFFAENRLIGQDGNNLPRMQEANKSINSLS